MNSNTLEASFYGPSHSLSLVNLMSFLSIGIYQKSDTTEEFRKKIKEVNRSNLILANIRNWAFVNYCVRFYKKLGCTDRKAIELYKIIVNIESIANYLSCMGLALISQSSVIIFKLWQVQLESVVVLLD